MFRVRRRSTTRTLALLASTALIASLQLVPTTAGGDTIAQTRKQIEDLSAALGRQEARSETTANEYDADKANLVSINANIVNLQSEEATKRAAIAVTSKKLVIDVVRAFVFGAAQAQIISLFNQNVTRSDAKNVFQDVVIGDLNQLKAKLQREKTPTRSRAFSKRTSSCRIRPRPPSRQ